MKSDHLKTLGRIERRLSDMTTQERIALRASFDKVSAEGFGHARYIADQLATLDGPARALALETLAADPEAPAAADGASTAAQ